MLPKPEPYGGNDIMQEIYDISVKNWSSTSKHNAVTNKQKRVENCKTLKVNLFNFNMLLMYVALFTMLTYFLGSS